MSKSNAFDHGKFDKIVIKFVRTTLSGTLDGMRRHLVSKAGEVMMVLDQRASKIIPQDDRYYVCTFSENQYNNDDPNRCYVKILEVLPPEMRLQFHRVFFNRHGQIQVGYEAYWQSSTSSMRVKFVVDRESPRLSQAGYHRIRPKAVLVTLSEDGLPVMSGIVIE